MLLGVRVFHADKFLCMRRRRDTVYMWNTRKWDFFFITSLHEWNKYIFDGRLEPISFPVTSTNSCTMEKEKNSTRSSIFFIGCLFYTAVCIYITYLGLLFDIILYTRVEWREIKSVVAVTRRISCACTNFFETSCFFSSIWVDVIYLREKKMWVQ